MVKKILIVISFFCLFLSFFTVVNAQEDAEKQEVENKIKEYQKKLDELRQQKNSLASQIQLFDTQVFLTQLRIRETEQKIVSTANEIDLLTSKIDGLDSSLDYLSKLLLKRAVAGYKRQSVSFVDVLLDSKNANEFINGLKYYKTVQDNNEKLVLQVQETKLNFVEQKALREKKKTQLDQLNLLLKDQKVALDSQKAQKQKLLTDTRNDESLYQKLLSQAEKQLASFKSFVQSSGGSSLIAANGLGSGSDGTYFSQRDERWGKKLMGYSSENVLDVGCLITSIAMLGKKFGSTLTPADLAAQTNRFWGSTAWSVNPWLGIAGKSYSGVTISNIDKELESGNPVIVGVKRYDCAAGGNHFVLLIKKEGDDWIMHDPIYGPDLKFSSHYQTVCSAGTFK